MSRRVARLLAIAFGNLGIVLCLFGGWGVWRIAAGLYDVNQEFFAHVDECLIVTLDRVKSLQTRVEKARMLSDEINQNLMEWPKRESKDRFIERLDIEVRAEKLSTHLQHMDARLETSMETIRGLQQLTSMSAMFGCRLDPASLELVVEKFSSAREKVKEIEESVQKVRRYVADDRNAKSRLNPAAKLWDRTLVSLSNFDFHVQDAVGRIGRSRSEAAELKDRTDSWITMITISCWAALVWVAVGQFALSAWGWRRGE